MDNHTTAEAVTFGSYGYDFLDAQPVVADCPGVAPETPCALVAAPAPSLPVVGGAFLDDCLRVQGDAGETLLGFALGGVDYWEERDKARRPIDQENHERLIECIIANGIRALFYRANGLVAASRAAGAYRTKPIWLSGESIGRALDLLVSAKIVEEFRGERGGLTTTYRLSPETINDVNLVGASKDSIRREFPPVGTLVRLRAKGSKEDVRFDQTEETLRWAADLDRYNRFVAGHKVELALSDAEKAAYLKAENEKRSKQWLKSRHNKVRTKPRQPNLIEPEFFNRHLYRVFNDGTFAHGGRMYGGFWQLSPKRFRRNITIDGKPTVELDYSGFVVRSIYHQRGIDYQGDPYEIPEVVAFAVEQGHKPDHYRESIKKLTMALLNHEKLNGHPELVGLEHSFKDRFKRAALADLIVAMHPEIADLFRTGEGKRNQRLDSDLALEVITNLMNKGILALPVHDSFIVQEEHEAALYDQMESCYYYRLGFEAIITKKVY